MNFGKFSIKQSETTLKGPHNIINTMSAINAALFAGVGETDIRAALKTFKNALTSFGICRCNQRR